MRCAKVFLFSKIQNCKAFPTFPQLCMSVTHAKKRKTRAFGRRRGGRPPRVAAGGVAGWQGESRGARYANSGLREGSAPYAALHSNSTPARRDHLGNARANRSAHGPPLAPSFGAPATSPHQTEPSAYAPAAYTRAPTSASSDPAQSQSKGSSSSYVAIAHCHQDHRGATRQSRRRRKRKRGASWAEASNSRACT